MLKCLIKKFFVAFFGLIQTKFQVVDFTTPIYSDRYRLFMRKPKKTFSWSTFSDVFSDTFWTVIVFCFVGLTCCLHVTLTFIKVYFIGSFQLRS